MTTLFSTARLTDEQASRFTGYPVSLPMFEGPLDLLLYLIRRQELDIYDIPIATITRQFLDYLALLESLDIEVAADFLVMAATLMEIKSRLLLPRPPVVPEEPEEAEDPRAELVRRLLEYQQYKSAAEVLHQRAHAQQRVFARPEVVQDLPFLRPEPILEGNADAFGLWTALQEVLARIETAGPRLREVHRPKLTIRQQMLHILKMLEMVPAGVSFAELIFYPGRDSMPTRPEVILTFLAVLELMRLRRIVVAQGELFGPIVIRAAHGQRAMLVD